MATSSFSRTGSRTAANSAAARASNRPAARAAARASRSMLLMGTLGLASIVLVGIRLLGTWRVGPEGNSHSLTILGQRLSYPTANLDGFVILLLAAVGAVVTARIARAAVHEIRTSRRFNRYLASAYPLPEHEAWLVVDTQPRAFCAGLLRPRVYVSTGASMLLDDQALSAVMAHEHHHARRYDPLRLAVGRVLMHALFFVPGLDQLVAHQVQLAELSADESAVSEAADHRSGLARAMLSFADAPSAGGSIGFDPGRVDYLLGEQPGWRFPLLLCLAAAATVGLFGMAVLLFGQLASGSATLSLPFLSHQPCIVILAVIPGAIALLAVAAQRRFSRRAPAAG